MLVRAFRHGSIERVRRYDRARDLPRLLQMWPEEIADATTTGRARVVARLRAALRAERRRGIGGHWTYDLTRHAQLLAAYRRESAELAVAEAAESPALPPDGPATRAARVETA